MDDKKYVFLDIDGTLMCGGSIPESAVCALKSAKERGHEFVICTGRSICENAFAPFDQFEFDGIICSSGARVQRGEQVTDHFFTPEECSEICRCLDGMGFAYRLMIDDRAFSNGEECEEYLSGERNNCRQFNVYGPPSLFEKLDSALGGRFNVVYDMSSCGDGTVCGEITPRGISKASGICDYLRLCGGDISATVAVGDSENDLAMIEFVNTGVAMGNACGLLKEKADVVTDRVECDGLAKAFSALGLV